MKIFPGDRVRIIEPGGFVVEEGGLEAINCLMEQDPVWEIDAQRTYWECYICIQHIEGGMVEKLVKQGIS